MIPQLFLEKMKALMGGEFDAFCESLSAERVQGLRVNTLKGSAERLSRCLPVSLRPVPWCGTGFYFDSQDRPGKHPLHEAGAYYIQEPSAMAAAELSGAMPGERILDLCAAPGGKSTHLACLTGDDGLLVCNEIVPDRALTLARNIERMGIRSAVVTNASPQQLAERFPGFFDRILVDAPCSGEGMFRKNELAGGEWSPAAVEMCAARQADILDCACSMLRPGGTLLYSTCTFSPEENERNVAALLGRRNELRLEELPDRPGFSRGRPEWADGDSRLRSTVRLFPHIAGGEGHFLAKIKSVSEEAAPSRPFWGSGKPSRARSGQAELSEARRAWEGFRAETLRMAPKGQPILFGERLFLVPEAMPPLDGLRVIRPGLELGSLKKGRFEPAHALAMALRPEECLDPFALDEESAERYLRGETLEAGSIGRGWRPVQLAGYSLGWCKQVDDTLKNHCPKGLRRG